MKACAFCPLSYGAKLNVLNRKANFWYGFFVNNFKFYNVLVYIIILNLNR